jgi:transcriptional regulator of arginine metabolism
MTVTRPGTKASRQAWVAATLADRPVRSQEELARLLAERGMPVTQATLSRDLEELGAVRVRGADGSLVYALPTEPGGPGSRPGGVGPGSLGPGSLGSASAGAGAPVPAVGTEPDPVRTRLSRTATELLISAEASANMVVLRTPAGAAQFLASVLDHAAWPSILGTIAGDDTVLVISRDPTGGDALAAQLLALAERRR